MELVKHIVNTGKTIKGLIGKEQRISRMDLNNYDFCPSVANEDRIGQLLGQIELIEAGTEAKVEYIPITKSKYDELFELLEKSLVKKRNKTCPTKGSSSSYDDPTDDWYIDGMKEWNKYSGGK